MLNCLKLIMTALPLMAGSSEAEPKFLSFSRGNYAELRWVVGPHTSGESVLEIQWRSSGHSGYPLTTPGEQSVVLWMPEHGHGSSPTKIEDLFDSQGERLRGAHRVTRIYFTMPGLWEVQLSLTYSDGFKETRILQVEL